MNQNNSLVIASGKYLRLSAHKTRRILNQIRGKKCADAILILEFMQYKPCKTIRKILESAMNNSKSQKELIIHEIFANEGPKLKRFQPRAQGRAFSIHKPTCHITIKLKVL
uniref:Large ribosomal subunit protein uL22c n=1 Tax=Dicranema revolutum TaxID=239144 RepID=A0A4D6WRG4_9FLOR|nr:ribosomal protein L22 [Dicranema revolutum]